MKNRLGRVFGVVGLLTSAIWLALSIAGLLLGVTMLDQFAANVDSTLAVTQDNLGAVQESLELTTQIIYSVNDTLDTVETTAIDASRALSETRPLLDETSTVVTQDLPEALDGVQDAMPNILNTVDLVDRTLAVLSRFQFVIPIPFADDLEFGLGVDYAPEVPLSQALTGVSTNLEGIPETLRDMRGSLDTASNNLQTISEDVSALSDDLNTVNAQIAEIGPQLEKFTASVGEINDSIETVRVSVPPALETAKVVFTILMAVLCLTQVSSFYLGWLLASGRLTKPG